MFGRLATLSAVLAPFVQAVPQASGTVITVNVDQTYQTFDGIGVAEAFQRSLVLHELNTQSQSLALDYLFSNTKGAGFTILRNGLGSSPDDPFDLMKSIAPTAPASNSSQVDHSFDMQLGSRMLIWTFPAQLHPSPSKRPIPGLALPSGRCQRCKKDLRRRMVR